MLMVIKVIRLQGDIVTRLWWLFHGKWGGVRVINSGNSKKINKIGGGMKQYKITTPKSIGG